jgi:hypothetical protein
MQFEHLKATIVVTEGHFTHEPRAMTMNLWEPKRKCPKAVPTKIMSCGHGSSSVVWSHMWWSPQPNVISMNFCSSRSSHMIKKNKKSTVLSIRSERVSRFCVNPTPERWFLNNNPSDHETWSIRCHVGIHVEFYIHLAFTYSVGPSSVVGSELGPAPPFPPMRVLEV